MNEGYKEATVLEAYLAESSTGTPSVKLKLNTEEGEIYADCWLTDAAIERAIKDMRDAFAFDGDFENLGQLVGKECQIKVVAEKYKGETRMKVAYVNPKGGRKPAMDEDKQKNLAKQFSMTAKQIIKKESGENPF